jgi:hypothetical protein
MRQIHVFKRYESLIHRLDVCISVIDFAWVEVIESRRSCAYGYVAVLSHNTQSPVSTLAKQSIIATMSYNAKIDPKTLEVN